MESLDTHCLLVEGHVGSPGAEHPVHDALEGAPHEELEGVDVGQEEGEVEIKIGEGLLLRVNRAPLWSMLLGRGIEREDTGNEKNRGLVLI